MSRVAKQIAAVILVAVMVLSSTVILNDGTFRRLSAVFTTGDRDQTDAENDAPIYSAEDRKDLEALAAIVLGEDTPQDVASLSDSALLALVEERIGPVADDASGSDEAAAPSVGTLEAAAGNPGSAYAGVLPEENDDADDPIAVTPEVREEFYNEDNEITAPFDEIFPAAVAEGLVDYDDETLLIKMAGEKDPLTDAVKAAGGAAADKLFDVGADAWYELKLAAGTDARKAVTAIRKSGDVLTAELNFEVTADALDDYTPVIEAISRNTEVGSQWALNHFGIPAGQAQMTNPGGSRNVVVAVVDTGVDYNHEDLANNIWTNTREIPDNGYDDDGNGYADDYYGVDLINNYGSAMDDNGHGTHVAGVIGAVNNNTGVVGVAYNVKLMPIKAADSSGNFTQSNIARAITYAYENGAEVINMSFGSNSITTAVQDALQIAYERCALVASAGNDGKPSDTHPNYPAALSYVLGVMSVGRDGAPSVFSNRNATPGRRNCHYELYAPGEAVLSTIPGNKYASWSGTSMAAPFVSAFAALLRSHFADRELYTPGFIYGQLINASTLEPEGENGPVAVDLYDAITEIPEPDLSVVSSSVYDTVGFSYDTAGRNNGDGVLDAGETGAMGVTIRNNWGRATDTVMSVSLEDEYVTLHTASVDFGGIGTYATKDSGKVIENDLQTAWERPVYFTVSPTCPNNHAIELTLTLTCKNAYSETQETYTFTDTVTLYVRSGKVISGIIEEDTVLTPENLYIITNSTTIKKGVTVRALPGTQIQFWTNDPLDPYRDTYMVYLKVEGRFLVEGTEENPVKIFPSELMDQYVVNIGEANGGYVSIDHAEITNLSDGNINCVISNLSHSTLKNNEYETEGYEYWDEETMEYTYVPGPLKQYTRLYYKYLSNGKVTTGYQSSYFYINNVQHNCSSIYKINNINACSFAQDLLIRSSERIKQTEFRGAYYGGGSYDSCTFYGDTYIWGSAQKCIFFKIGVNCSANCDTCAFIDCFGALNDNEFENTKYTNCVFYGNNRFSNGKPSSSTLAYNAKAISFKPENNVSYVYNPNTGSTYVRIDAAAYVGNPYSDASGAFPWEDALFALGWDYAVMETPEEYAFLRSTSLLNSDYYEGSYNVGTYIQDGVLCWHNGTPVGEFMKRGSRYWTNSDYSYLLLTSNSDYTYHHEYDEYGNYIGDLRNYYRNLPMYSVSPSSWLFEIPGPIYVTEITPQDSYVKLDMSETYAIRVTCTPATPDPLHYVSADETIVTVDEEGVVTPVGPGKTQVLIFAPDYGVFTMIDVEIVEEVPLTGIEMLAGKTVLQVGEEMDLTLRLTPADTSKRDIRFASSDPSVFTVDPYGHVRAVGRGYAQITASCGDISDSVTLRGYKQTAVLSLPTDGMVIYTDDGWTDLPEVTVSQDADYELTWKSSDENVLMERGGRLLPVNPGVVSLMVKDTVSGKSASMPVFVSDAVNEKQIVKMGYNQYDMYFKGRSCSNVLFALYDDGSLWYWTDLAKPPQLWMTEVKDFDLDGYYGYYIILKTDGSIVAYNDYIDESYYYDEEGNYCVYRDTPIADFCAAHTLKAVYCGYNSNYAALTEDGYVYAWGENNNGMLGVGSGSYVGTPTLVNLENVTDVFMYYHYYTWFLTADGSLYRSGGGDYTPVKQGEGFERLYKMNMYNAYALKNGIWYTISDEGGLYDYYSYTQMAAGDTVPGWHVENGAVYGQYYIDYPYSALPDVVNPTGAFRTNNVSYVTTADGGLYEVSFKNGGNGRYVPYIQTTVCPAGVEIQPFAVEKTNVYDGLLYDSAVTVDFNAKLVRVNYRLYEDGVQIPCSYEMNVDEGRFYLAAGFKPGAEYELRIMSDGTTGSYLYALPGNYSVTFTLAPAGAEPPADESCPHPAQSLVHTPRVPAACVTDGATPGVTCNACHRVLGGFKRLPALGHNLTAHPANPATCLETGWDLYYTCTRCDYTSFAPLDALGHTYETSLEAPTCTEEGLRTYTCTVCNYSYSVAVPALGHTAATGETLTPPTCTEPGVMTCVCERCGASFETAVPATGHSYDAGEETLTPTCETAGTRIRTCENCGATVTEEISALGHDWGEYLETTAAGCENMGEFTRVCSRCPAEQSYTVPALGHDMDAGTVTLAATCTATGTLTYACSRCDYTETETLPVLGHSYDAGADTVPATCTVPGTRLFTCTREGCGSTLETEIPAPGHSYNDGVLTTDPTCTEPGETTFTCTACGHSYTRPAEATGHAWTLTETLTAPDCVNDGVGVYVCENCGETKEDAIPALGHDAEIIAAKAPTCLMGGWEQYEICSRCGENDLVALDPLGHDIVSVVEKVPTCTHEGYTAYEYCTRCDYRTDSTVLEIVPENHVWNEGYLTLKLTESIYGKKTYVCLEDPAHVKTENEADDLVITVYGTTVDDTVYRHYWTLDEIVDTMKEAIEARRYNPFFHNNTVINRLTADTEVTHWLRVLAPSASTYTEYYLGENYWGTDKEAAIDLQMLDYNDFTDYALLAYKPYLTAVPETTYPVVTDIAVTNAAGEALALASNEEITVTVTFSRDMDTETPVDVSFGWKYPFDQVTVIGAFTDARTWVGTVRVGVNVENGIQYFAVSGGKAATEDLILIPDTMRFFFTVDTTSAQALIMQGEAEDDGITLNWTQDDFDTLMGYNVYRSTSQNGYYSRLNRTVIPADTKTFFDDTVEPGRVYYYNFTVVKTDMTESTPSGKIVIMSKDTMAPNIYHSPVYDAFTGSNLIISATVTDNIAVSAVSVHYRTVGETGWHVAVMNKLNDKYSVIIPADQLSVNGLEYYIEATDGVSFSRKGSAQSPYVVSVREALDDNALGDVNNDGKINNLDALMIIQAINDMINLDADQFARADLNGDGELTAAEALRILQYVSGVVGSVKM